MTDLLAIKRELERVIAEDAFQCTTAEARSWLRAVKLGIANPDDWRGWFGNNGYLPTIRACIETADWHAKQGRLPASPSGRARGDGLSRFASHRFAHRPTGAVLPQLHDTSEGA